MADISSFLKKILEAVYGKEVRGSIHDALSAMNLESGNAMAFAATAQDSAKASAAQAKDSADAAAVKAGESADSAGAAKTSEDNAKDSETTAAQKASEASTSAAGAKTSEVSAANSEAAALQKAAEAEASRSAAALSEENTLAAEQRTNAVKTEVEVLSAQVKTDREAAETAKTGAETAKDAAASSAETAAEDALTALEAKTDAETAKTAAEAAKAAAEQARTDAETAKSAAEQARTDAETARDSAGTSAADAAESASSARQYSGKPPKPQDGTWWIWNAERSEYENTGVTSEIAGPIGNGIMSIELTSGSHLPGETDVYTITMTDGTTKEVPVFQGKNGEGVGNIIGDEFDLLLPVADWSNCELTLRDSRFLASRRYKYFISAYDDSLVEVRECTVDPKDITVNGQISFTAEIAPINPIMFNVLRLEVSVNQSP